MADGIYLTWFDLGFLLFVAACTGVVGHLSGALWYTRAQFERHKRMLFDEQEGAIPKAVRELKADLGLVSDSMSERINAVEVKIHESIGGVRSQISTVKLESSAEVQAVRADVARISGEINAAVRAIEVQVEGTRTQVNTLTAGLTRDLDKFREEIDNALGEIPAQKDLESLGDAIQSKTVAAIQGWWGSRVKEVREEMKKGGGDGDPESAELVAEIEGLVGKKQAGQYVAGYKVIDHLRKRRAAKRAAADPKAQPPRPAPTNTPAAPPGPSTDGSGVTPPGSRGPLKVHPDILAALEREGFKRERRSPRKHGKTPRTPRGSGPVKPDAPDPTPSVPP